MSPRPALPLRLEYILLGLIRRQPVHGYDLLRHWNEPGGIGLVWQVKTGRLYAALEKLEQLGSLHPNVIATEFSPLRKEYQITPSGEQIFLDWMKTPVPAARDFRQDFLAKVYFSNEVPPGLMTDLFHQQKLVSSGWLASLQSRLIQANPYEQQVLSFRIHQVKSILNWLNEQPFSETIPDQKNSSQ